VARRIRRLRLVSWPWAGDRPYIEWKIFAGEDVPDVVGRGAEVFGVRLEVDADNADAIEEWGFDMVDAAGEGEETLDVIGDVALDLLGSRPEEKVAAKTTGTFTEGTMSTDMRETLLTPRTKMMRQGGRRSDKACEW